MALAPLGSVRGPEGLTVWEYIAFAHASSCRYRSGDDEQDEYEEYMFEWHQQFAEYQEQMEEEDEEEEYFDDEDDDQWWWDDEEPLQKTKEDKPPFVYRPPTKKNSFAGISYPKPIIGSGPDHLTTDYWAICPSIESSKELR